MSNLTVTPVSALLTVGQPITFTASVGDKPASDATWTLSPPTMGTLVSPPTPPGSTIATTGPSITYVAPPTIADGQSVAIIATTNAETASATVSLTSKAITVVPDSASLAPGKKQEFVAIVASAEHETVRWICTPPLGEVSQEGLYSSPDTFAENCAVKVIATDRFGRHSEATISLVANPWGGVGVYLLGIYLFCVFSLIIFLVGLIPARVPNVEVVKADRAQADAALQKLIAQRAELKASLPKPATPNAGSPTRGRTSSDQIPTNPHAGPAGSAISTTPATGRAASTAAQTQATATPAASLVEMDQQVARAQRELDYNDKALKDATASDVDILLLHHRLNREVDLLLLVLLAGALGSFLHIAQSFSDFVGNRSLKSSWAWWCALRPFVGAALAFIVYAAVRGGLITVAAVPSTDASSLNPYSLVGAAALAGLFSKDATQKLGEVFASLFRTEKAGEARDKLVPTSQPSNATAPSATGAGAQNTAAR
jgi:hypothetical protein